MASDSRLSSSRNNRADSPPDNPNPNPETARSSSSDPILNPNPEPGHSPSPSPSPYPPPPPGSYYYGPHPPPPYTGPTGPYHPAHPIPYYPPPPPVYPVYQDPKEEYRAFNCLCRFFLVLITIPLILSVIGLIVTSTGQYPLPAITLTRAALNSFTVTSPAPSSSSSSFTADFNLTFSLKNPSKDYGITYVTFSSAVSYAESAIAGWSPQEGIDQGADSEANLTARTVSVDNYVDPWDLRQMREEIGRNGGKTVGFVGRVQATVQYTSGIWLAAGREIDVFCPGIMVEVVNGTTTTTGKVTGTPVSCIVR